MRRTGVVISVILMVAVLVMGFGCSKPAPTPTPSPTKPAPAVSPKASPAPSPKASPAPTAKPTAAPSPKPTPKPTAKPKPPTPAAGWPKSVQVGTLPSGTALYTAIVAVTKMISQYTGVGADPAVYAIQAPFYQRLSEAKLDLAVGNNIDQYNAMRGLDAWKGTPFTSHRFLFTVTKQVIATFATASSGIKTMADVKGKKYMCEQPASPSSVLIFGAVRQVYGIAKDNTTIIPYVSTADIASGMKEGRIDAAIWYLNKATPFLKELILTKDLAFVSLDDAKGKEIAALVPVVPDSLPAGSYKGQDQPWKGVGLTQGFIARDTLPDDLVYAIVAAVYNNFKEYSGYVPALEGNTLPEQLDPAYFTIPVHAGAIKYYKEKGWWKKEHEDKQAALLKELKLQK